MTIESQFDRIHQDTALLLPGALKDAIRHKMFSVVDELCKFGGIWKDEQTLHLKVNKTDYDIVPEYGGKIVRLDSVKDMTDAPIAASLPFPGVLRMGEAPTVAYDVVVTTVCTITDPIRNDKFPNMPEWLLDQHNDTIKHGIVGYMMLEPSKPYSNSSLATYYMRKFRNYIATARANVEAGHVTSQQNWTFPPFA